MENTELIEVVKSTANDLKSQIETKLADAERKVAETAEKLNQIEKNLNSFNPMTKVKVNEEKSKPGDAYAMMVYAKAKGIIEGKSNIEVLGDYAKDGFTPAKTAISLMMNNHSDSDIKQKAINDFESYARRKSISVNDIASGSGFSDPTTDPAFAGWLQAQSVIANLPGIKRRTFINSKVKINKGANPGTVYWVDSNDPIPDMALTFAQEVIYAKKAAGYVPISNDTLRTDVRNALVEIQSQMQTAMANGIDSALINADGSEGKPLGLLNIPGVANVAAQGSPTTKKIGMDLRAAETYMYTENVYPTAPVWLFHPQTIGYLLNQTSSDGQEIFYAREINERKTLFGIPVVKTTFMPNTKAVLFDASRFVVGESYGLIVDASTDHQFLNDQTVIRAITNTGCGLEFNKAAYVITGVNTWNV